MIATYSPNGTHAAGKTIRQNLSGESWATLRAGAGTGSDSDFVEGGFAGEFVNIKRGLIFFDTSKLAAGSVITAATLRLWVASDLSESGTATVGITKVGAGISSNTDVRTNSYYNIANHTSTRVASDVNIASMTPGTTEDFSLNATGLAAIVPGGVTKFAVRLGWDIDNTSPPGGDEAEANATFRTINTSFGGSVPPELIVTFTPRQCLGFFQLA